MCYLNPYFLNLQVQAHFGKQMPLLFLYVKESACARARKVLKMTSAQSLFLDVSSSDETQKRITILPEKLSDENKSTLKSIFGDLIQVTPFLKRLESLFQGTLYAKMTMSDLQQYPWNPNLIKKVEDSRFCCLDKFSSPPVSPLLFRSKKCASHFAEKPRIKNSSRNKNIDI